MGITVDEQQHIMKFLVVLAIALTATQAFDLDTEWEHFKLKYGRNLLTGQEHDARKNIFANNLKFIEKHNAEHALGLHTHTVGINQFADLTNEEFVQQFTGFKAMDGLPESSVEIIGRRPAQIDWRQKNAVTPVKDQGQCGSCWAFSAIGTIEGAYAKKSGLLVSLSEQNLVDCSTYINNGCNGGNPFVALLFTIQQGGIATEKSYPYEAQQANQCRYEGKEVGASISDARRIKQGSEEDLQNALAEIGPVSVAIDAANPSFRFYKEGVYYEENCSSTNLNHGVLAVGYGTTRRFFGQDYYIVKNSWGTGWGDSGYIKMAMNRNNHCGIASTASYAIF